MARKSPRFAIDLIRNACAEGEPNAIAELASDVENAINWRNRRVETGETTPVVRFDEIPDSEAGHFLYRLVRACGEHGHAPPPELIRLVQTFTKQDRPPGGKGRRRRKDSDWLVKAAAFWHDNPDARPADLARVADVNRSTIGKAIKSGRLRPPIVANKEVH